MESTRLLIGNSGSLTRRKDKVQHRGLGLGYDIV